MGLRDAIFPGQLADMHRQPHRIVQGNCHTWMTTVIHARGCKARITTPSMDLRMRCSCWRSCKPILTCQTTLIEMVITVMTVFPVNRSHNEMWPASYNLYPLCQSHWNMSCCREHGYHNAMRSFCIAFQMQCCTPMVSSWGLEPMFQCHWWDIVKVSAFAYASTQELQRQGTTKCLTECGVPESGPARMAIACPCIKAVQTKEMFIAESAPNYGASASAS